MARGRVVSFDQTKGYGFVAPDSGGEDVFLHVNDMSDPKYLMRPGVVVDFVVEDGDRGPKASSVRIISPQGPADHAEPAFSERTPADGEFFDVLSANDFRREVTECLLVADSSLTAGQITRIRERLAELGLKYGWVDK
ncbi:cold-shock protein [Fodinicola acaciae]|uniref:cold-shock protein n=1 Tax=Fodinicola acaciae TaxID=2681555 RepID=UPI0013D5C8E0|nr:cold shock domain-containing protein [Fodinicola acaciae]